MNQGTLYIISAPSGAGKTSLVNAVVNALSKIKISISHTTRPMRPGEKSGIDYHFVSESKFKDLLKENIFLETAEVYGFLYGTSAKWVQETLQKGEDVILEIDWQGARQVRIHFIDAISIYIFPPNQETLRSRLEQRHQDNKEVIERRMKEAKNEISRYTEYDYLICNDQFSEAVEDLKSIIQCHRLQLRHQEKRMGDIIRKLMS